MHLWKNFMTIYWIVYIIGVIILKFKLNKSNTFVVMSSIMYIYFIWVIKYTIFPIPYDEMSINIYSEIYKWNEKVNLIPFMVDSKFVLQKTMLLNILLTMPLGFGINFLYGKKFKLANMLIIGLLAGLILEGTQLIISIILGFPYKYIDVTDFVCNLIGCVIGYIGFLIFTKLWVIVSNKIEINSEMYKEIDCICKR